MAKSFSNQENFYKRLRELSNVDAPSKSVGLDQQTLVEFVRASDGQALGIIKEDASFFIKSSNTKGDIAVQDFTYIGGLENKLKYKYDTLAEAKKNLNFFVGALNEAMERKFNVALLKEEKEILSQTNADKGGIATAQDKADKENKGETLKDSAQEKEVDAVLPMDGIAKNQSEGDKNKSDDASQKLKQEHEPSQTSSGAARGDIAKAQSNADAVQKATHSDKAPEKPVDNVLSKGGAAKNQSMGDQNKGQDASAKLKTSEPKEVEPASDAKKEKAIVIENFGEQDPAAAVAAAPAPAGAPAMGAPSAEGIPAGDESSDLDAAASALDALDIKADAAASPDASAMGGSPDAAGVSAEVPSGDVPNAGAEAGGANDGVDADPTAQGGDEAALKDVEKLVGKTAQKIRATEITDEMIGGFLKSLIQGFDGKLENLDSELRREIANKILKAGEEGEGGESSAEPAVSGAPAADSSADSAPATSADPAADGGNDAAPAAEPTGDEEGEPDDKEIEEAINRHLAEMGMGDEGGSAAEPSNFEKYMNERGYTNEDALSIMEATSLIGGFINECGEVSQADAKTIAEFMSPEVKKELTECGFGKFAESVDVFNVKPKSYKSMEPVLESNEEVDEKKVEESKVEFAPVGQSLNKTEKEAKSEKPEDKEDEKKEDKKEEVSESAKTKLKAIINAKIQEHLGLKKPSINESSKSAFSKKLDAMIAEEIRKGKEALAEKRANKDK
jgi:hypothetical protein